MNRFQKISDFLVSFARPNPSRDWFLTLMFLFIPLIIFICYAAYLFFGIQSGFIVHTETVSFPAQTITEGEIQSVLNAYRARKANYEADREPLLPIVDPAGSSSVVPKIPLAGQ